MVPLSFAGHDFFADPQGALWWPARRALLVADLHLEKASWYAKLGQFLPPYDSQATLAALTEVVDRTGVERLYCLGDSFHDKFGCDRLPEAARAMLLALTARLDWTWILGNHDPGFADHCGGTLMEEVEVAGVIRHMGRLTDGDGIVTGQEVADEVTLAGEEEQADRRGTHLRDRGEAAQ